jgi:hypothetical protein
LAEPPVEMTSKPRATKPEANLSKFVLSETEIKALGFADDTIKDDDLSQEVLLLLLLIVVVAVFFKNN